VRVYLRVGDIATSLTQRTAVVTGGGSGVGTMIATAYAQNGAKVYIASRKEKQLKEVRAMLSSCRKI
jgi:NADP-dependent 3-hydroxy acid dehydrogenase YdfG